MKKTFLRILLPILIVLMLVTTVTVVAIAANDGDEELPDAMIAIRADEELEQKLLNTYSLADDGYLGIPIDFAIYHNGSPVVAGCNGTNVIMYVVNTRSVRAGTDSDASIIKSMLDRGYIVAVADFHHSKKAVGADLDWCAQHVVQSMKNSAIFKAAGLPTSYIGSYQEVFLVPAGHNVERDLIFWSFDKHAMDGTLEKIVEVWNLDFRGMKGSVVIPWHVDGVRKDTQKGIHDGSDPVWYSPGTGEGAIVENGKSYVPDPEGGLYIRVMHTKANEITDCVKPDGSPIDLNLYMHVIYPTNPEKAVPVMTLASSSEHLASGCVSANRPHTNGFGFDGYGVVMYDYAYIPMARTDHYNYFDGSSMDSGSVTGDNFTYSLFTYNSTLVPTAAIRYIRYLALTQPEKFAFNGTVGVIGNSKGSMITQLADKTLGHVKSTEDGYTEAELETYAYEYIKSYIEYYYHEGKTGKTRYDEGLAEYTKSGVTIRSGEIQPWLTYEGEMIPSNVQFAYSSCGGTNSSINENFAPFMTSAHIGIETNGYGSNNHLINIARYYDVPFLWFELVLGHTFLARESHDWGIDPYVGYKSFANYVLNNGAPIALYATPLSESEITATPSFTVKFTGMISPEEITKATLTDSKGNAVLGVWTSQYGRTEWTFTPANALVGGETYTLNVPTTIVAENGQNVAEPFSSTYHVEVGNTLPLSMAETVVTSTAGVSIPLTVPNFADYADKNVNRAELRLFVSDNAANSLSVYLGDESGECLDTVPVGGIGQYALDLTEALGNMTPGEVITLFVKANKATGESRPTDAKFSFEDFEDGAHSFNLYTSAADYSYKDFTDGHGKALGIAVKYTTGKYNDTHKYYTTKTALAANSLLPTKVTDADYGRRFLVTFELYDTSSRIISTSFNSLSNQNNLVTDFHNDRVNTVTKAGEWVSVSLLLTLDDPIYGKSGLSPKSLTFSVGPTGGDEAPVYIDNFAVTEITTDVTLSSASLVLTADGGEEYKKATAEHAFLVGSTSYATFAEAIAALGTTDGTITLQRNITLTDSTVFTNFKAANVTIDLNGYAVRNASTYNSVVSVNSATVKNITVKNGSVFLLDGSLVGFENTRVAADVTVTFENVHIGTEIGANIARYLVHTDSSSGTASKLHLILTECAVDARIERMSKTPAIVFPTSTSKVSLSYTVRGGEIYMSRTDKTTLLESMKDIRFEQGEDGMTVLYLSAARALTTMAVITEDGFANFAPDTTPPTRAGYLAYTPKADGELSTPYGIIPEKYADEEAYPLVVFDRTTFECIGASNILIQDSGAGAFNTVYNTKGDYVIYLRRDYTHSTASYNIGFINSHVTVDLGGYTLTYTRGITPQSKKANSNCNVTFMNGTLKAASTEPFIAPSAVTNSQPMTFTFDQVTFAVAEGYAPTVWVSKTAATSSVSAQAFPLRVTVKDCTFDVSGLSAKTTIFAIGHSTGLIDDKVTVIGSNIKGTPALVTLYSMNGTENCSITFEKNDAGNYITNTRPTTDGVPDLSIKTEDGIMIFSKAVATEGEMTTYALALDPMVTPYGRIPAEYAKNPEKYPILLFQLSTGNVIWAGDRWGGESTYGGALYQLSSNKSKGDMAIYFQADHVDVADPNGNLNPFYNFGCITGNHIIDLNGHTLTAATTVLQAQAKNNNFTSAVTWTVKNGTINLGSQVFLQISSGTYDQQYTMDATYIIENVNFTNITSGYIVRDGSSDLGFLTTSDVTFRDCTFDVVSSRTAEIFYLGSSAKSATFSVDIKLEGGSITYAANKLPPMFRDGGMTNKTFIYGEGTNGLPTITIAKTSTVMFTDAVKTTVGDRYLIQDEVDEGDKTTFYFCEKHEYGYIPHKYTDTEKYPFLLFQLSTGKILWAGDRWGGESTYGGVLYQLSRNKSKGDMAVLMQADHVDVADPDGKLQTFYNFGCITGNHIIDLGGHTLTAATLVLNGQAKNQNFTSTVTWTIKNGTISLGSQGFLQIASNKYDQQYTMDATYIIENIDFVNINGGYIVRDTNNSSGDFLTNTHIIFRGCTFDIIADPTVALFSMGNTGTSTFTIDIKVEGGHFSFVSAKQPPFFATGNMSNKSFSFGKYNGAYTTFRMPTADLSTLTLPGTDGVLGVRRIASEGKTALYTMTPFSFVSAYLNLTSELNLIYRAYLPAGYTAPTVTFTIGDITRVVSAYTVDENGLYLFRLPSITPAMMGEVVTATLTASLNGESVAYVCDTLSAKSYLETLKAENSENAALIDLIEKLLVYGAAAQQYVGQDAEDFVTEIGELEAIPESENVITMTGTASDIATFTKLSLSLDGAYALRLKIALTSTEGLTLKVTKGAETETIDLGNYEITDGSIVVTVDDIFANELDEEITFTLEKDGTEIGKTLTASVNAYLYRISIGANDNLSTLARALYAYGKAVKAYAN